MAEADPNAEDVDMYDADVKQIGKVSASAGSSSAYDSDDDEGAARGVQCQQS